MELEFSNGTCITLDPSDLVQVAIFPDNTCQYILKGMANGTAGVIGNRDGKQAYRKLATLIERRAKERNTLAAYAANLEN